MKAIRFYQNRKTYLIISAVVMVIGIIGILINGVSLDIQFKGGAILKYNCETEVDVNKLESVVSDFLNRPVSAQLTSDLATGSQRVVLNLAGEQGLDAAVQEELEAVMNEAIPDARLTLSESMVVEPFLGRTFLVKGIIALALSAILIILYVWVRFRKIGGLSAGLMAVLALAHDVIVVFITCVLFKIPLGDSFVAVALSIIGFSVNDTIVVYDRIRENERTIKGPLEDLVNVSITQSLTRSLNTSVAVFLSVTIVYVLAFAKDIGSVQAFALPMAIGTISGCYSTVCIAGPFWVVLKKRQEEKKAHISAPKGKNATAKS